MAEVSRAHERYEISSAPDELALTATFFGEFFLDRAGVSVSFVDETPGVDVYEGPTPVGADSPDVMPVLPGEALDAGFDPAAVQQLGAEEFDLAA